MQKQFEDPDAGTITVRKNTRSRRITLRVKPRGGVAITIPYYVTYDAALGFFRQKKDWVLKVQEKLKSRVDNDYVPTAAEIEELRAKAKAILPARLAELAAEHSFVYNAVRIKHNSSNWGSCSRKGNINLNLNLVRVPDELRDYVLLHELCHLRVPNHGPQFHALLESVCPNHRAKEKALRQYHLV